MSEINTARTRLVVSGEPPYIEMGPPDEVSQILTDVPYSRIKSIPTERTSEYDERVKACRTFLERLAGRLGNDYPETPRRLSLRDVACIAAGEFIEGTANFSHDLCVDVKQMLDVSLEQLCIDGTERRYYDLVMVVLNRQLRHYLRDVAVPKTRLVIPADKSEIPRLVVGPLSEILAYVTDVPENEIGHYHSEGAAVHQRRVEMCREFLSDLARKLANPDPHEERSYAPEELVIIVADTYREFREGQSNRTRETAYQMLGYALENLCVSGNYRRYYQRVMAKISRFPR